MIEEIETARRALEALQRRYPHHHGVRTFGDAALDDLDCMEKSLAPNPKDQPCLAFRAGDNEGQAELAPA